MFCGFLWLITTEVSSVSLEATLAGNNRSSPSRAHAAKPPNYLLSDCHLNAWCLNKRIDSHDNIYDSVSSNAFATIVITNTTSEYILPNRWTRTIVQFSYCVCVRNLLSQLICGIVQLFRRLRYCVNTTHRIKHGAISIESKLD